MPALANKVGNDPVHPLFAGYLQLSTRSVGAPKTASWEDGERGVVSFAAKTANVHSPQESLPLLR